MLLGAYRYGANRKVLTRILLLGLGMVMAVMPMGRNALPRAQAAGGATAIPHGMEKIQHVVWIIQENHSFDNYFGTFPNADGIPPSTCLAEMPGSKKCVKPFHMPAGQPLAGPRTQLGDRPGSLRPRHHGRFRVGGRLPLHDGILRSNGYSQLLAVRHRYTLCDRFFSSEMTGSSPNHVFTVAAQSGEINNIGSLEQLDDDLDEPEGFPFESIVKNFGAQERLMEILRGDTAQARRLGDSERRPGAPGLP